jgi:MFS transporter, FSR family, fosmidomycin resistance protein
MRKELMPDGVGMVSGMFFGIAFGAGGVEAVVLGALADWMSIQSVYRLCVFLPVIGLLTAVLPYIEEHKIHGDLGCMIWHRYAMVGIA